MSRGPIWSLMDAQERRPARHLTATDVPTTPGVYAWYRGSGAIYAGRALGAGGLRGRVWTNHLATGLDLSRSSFRRNVCEHLGIAPTSVTRMRPSVMTSHQVGEVNQWIRDCEVAWIRCGSGPEAKALERALLNEAIPSLSKR